MLALKQPVIERKLAGASLRLWVAGVALAAVSVIWLARAYLPLPLQASIDTRAPVLQSAVTGEDRWLGMKLEDSPPPSAGSLRPLIVVRQVQPGSPAARAGVQPGDVLLVVQDQLMNSTRQVAQVLRTLPPHAPVMLELTRSGNYLVLTAPAN